MKSEERHRLQRNALAEWLVETYGKIAPYLTPILGGLATLAVILVIVSWWRRSAATTTAAACDQLFAAASDTDRLDELASANAKRNVGLWAMMIASDQRLERGARAMFSNRAGAAKDLQEAAEGFSKVLEGKPDPLVRAQAQFGLARAYESLLGTRQSGEYYDKAIAEYEAIEKAKNAFSADATKRLSVLKSPAGLDFYKKFAEYNPPRPPETGAFGKLPFDTTAPPDQGSGFSKTILNLDDLSKKIDSEKKTPEKSDKPAADKTAPPAKTPAADTPAPKSETPKK